MEAKEFTQKLILLILEKCVIVIIISIVGLFINGQLKKIDLNNNKIILAQQAQNDSLINVYEEKRLSLQNEYSKKSNLLIASIDSTNNERLNDMQENRDNQERIFLNQINKFNARHDNELARIEQNYNKELQEIQSTLDAGICSLESDFRLHNRIDINTIENIAKVWNKIYEYDYIADRLVRHIVLFDSLATILETTQDQPFKETLNKQIKDIKKSILDCQNEYNINKEDVNRMIKEKRYWLKDELIIYMQEYISLVDSIVEIVIHKKRKYYIFNRLYRNTGYNHEVLDSLKLKKKQIRRTINNERESLRTMNG